MKLCRKEKPSDYHRSFLNHVPSVISRKKSKDSQSLNHAQGNGSNFKTIYRSKNTVYNLKCKNHAHYYAVVGKRICSALECLLMKYCHWKRHHEDNLPSLLHFSNTTDGIQILHDLFTFFDLNPFFNYFRCPFDEFFSLLQTQACDCPDFFNYFNFA